MVFTFSREIREVVLVMCWIVSGTDRKEKEKKKLVYGSSEMMSGFDWMELNKRSCDKSLPMRST